jgi:hypothetical protein
VIAVAPVRWAAVVTLIAVALVACSQSREDTDGLPTSSESPIPIASTVLVLQVTDDAGYAVQNVVMGTLPEGEQPTPSLAYVPPSLLMETADDPPQVVTLGETPLLPDSGVVAGAVGATLAIPVEGSVTMDRLAFAGLVDAVGGAWIELAEPESLPPDDQGVVTTLPAGLVRLDGITAATYVTAPRLNESEQVSMERFAAVWTAVLRRLPVNPDRTRALVINLGSLARSTVSTDVLVAALDRARAGMRNREEAQMFVSVDTIRGGARPASVLNAAGSRTVALMFAPFEPSSKAISDDTDSSARVSTGAE